MRGVVGAGAICEGKEMVSEAGMYELLRFPIES